MNASPADLVALDVLLETRNVTSAAQRLGVSQSAVSHTLRRLRRDLRDPLFVGTRGGLVPTLRAEEIAPLLRSALLDLRASIEQGARFDPATARNGFIIACADYGEFMAMPDALERMRNEAPGITIRTEPDGDLAARLASGAVDLAFTVRTQLAPSLRQATLGHERYRVALRRGHPALRRSAKRGARKSAAPQESRLSLVEYCALEHVVVSPRGLPGSPVDEALASRSLSRRVVLRLANFVTAPFIVATSDLVTTLGEPLLRAASRFVDIELLAPPLPLPSHELVMVWHERTQHSPAHAFLRRLVTETTRPLFR